MALHSLVLECLGRLVEVYRKEWGRSSLFFWGLEFWEDEVAVELLFQCSTQVVVFQEEPEYPGAAATWRVNSALM